MKCARRAFSSIADPTFRPDESSAFEGLSGFAARATRRVLAETVNVLSLNGMRTVSRPVDPEEPLADHVVGARLLNDAPIGGAELGERVATLAALGECPLDPVRVLVGRRARPDPGEPVVEHVPDRVPLVEPETERERH